MNSLFDFAPFITEANPEHWEGFPELMWNLGFEMDCYASAPRFDTYTYPTHTNKEIQDQLLMEMQRWDTQLVGNYIFSRYRYLTHWCDYGYPEEEGAYFFQRAFPILERKLLADWDTRNRIPTFEEFSKLVTNHFIHFTENRTEWAKEFVDSDEGQFYIRMEYEKALELYSQKQIIPCQIYGRCIQNVVHLLESMA